MTYFQVALTLLGIFFMGSLLVGSVWGALIAAAAGVVVILDKT